MAEMSQRTPSTILSLLAAAARTALLAALLAIPPAGCDGVPRADGAKAVEFRGSTMSTRYRVMVFGLPAGVTREALGRRIEAALASVNRQMSTYLPDSEISRFNRHRGTDWFAVAAETAAVVRAALEVSRLTDGAFDVTVGPLVNLWGFGPEARQAASPTDASIARCRARVGWRHLEVRLDPPALRKQVADLSVDLSAIAKGHGVDRVSARLDAAGVTAWMVEIGGEVRTRGRKPDGSGWRIGIEAPRVDRREVLEKLTITDLALATSGNYRNFFEREGKRYGHTLDPRSGRPVEHRLGSVTVVAPTCMRADALATALMVLGPEAGLALATRQRIAALFLLPGEAGIERKATAAFPATAREVR